MILESEFPASFTVDDSFDDKQPEEEFEEKEENLENEGFDTYDEFSED